MIFTLPTPKGEGSVKRIGLQKGILPFGYAIKMSSKWTYHISEAKVYEYLGKEKKTV